MSKQDYISLDSRIVCPNCNANAVNIITDSDSGELVCRLCGYVIPEHIRNMKPEWYAPTSEHSGNNNERTGMPISLARHDMGLSTIIGRADRDYSGNRIDSSLKSTIDRLRILDYRTQLYSSTDRSLKRAFAELDTLKDKLALPNSVVEKEAYIYRKAQERGLVRGRTMHAMLAAAIYIARRQLAVGKTLNEISQESNVKSKMLSHSYRVLLTELDIKAPMLDPLKCIAKVANKMKLNERITRHAMGIIHETTRKEITAGKDPMGLAAAVLYMSCIDNSNPKSIFQSRSGDKKSQIAIAQAAGITDVTLRHTLKDLKNNLVLVN
jgi:transcription initiation factor TFIIB